MKTIDLRSWSEEFSLWAQKCPEGAFSIWGRVTSQSTEFELATARDYQGSVLYLKPHFERHTTSQTRPKQSAVGNTPPSTTQQRSGNEANEKKLMEAEKAHEKAHKEWLFWWSKIAVRSGYMYPNIDAESFITILELRSRAQTRVEFIFDTNALINGVGHWLVRALGPSADLVRTTVSDLEVQEFGDRTKWMPTDDVGVSTRGSFLAASRFLERAPHSHPIWRRLDTDEETALFVAHSSDKDGQKSPGRDTLLLRATRRAILDQVPGLRRFFVTSDQKLARAAGHELPAGSTIAAYVNSIPKEGAYLTPIMWFPIGGDQGSGELSNLACFVWEALCLCDEIRISGSNGAEIVVRAVKEDTCEFPSSWASPRVFVYETQRPEKPLIVGDKSSEMPAQDIGVLDASTTISAAPRRPEVPPIVGVKSSETTSQDIDVLDASTTVSAVARDATNSGQDQSRKPDRRASTSNLGMMMTASQKTALDSETLPTPDRSSSAPPSTLKDGAAPSDSWPFRKQESLLLPTRSGRPAVPATTFLNVISAVRDLVQGTIAELDLVSMVAPTSLKDLKLLLEMGQLLDRDGKPMPLAEELPQIFDSNDLDMLSRQLTIIDPYNIFIKELRQSGSIPLSNVRQLVGRSVAVSHLGRLLGQAVLVDRVIYDGGKFISKKAFVEWFLGKFDKLSSEARLGEVRISELATLALTEKSISPIRFGRALGVAMSTPEFASIELATGGAFDRILDEEVVTLLPEGIRAEMVSADGLLGYRTVKRRPS